LVLAALGHDIPELRGVGFADQLEVVAKQNPLGVASLKRDLGGVFCVAQAIAAKRVPDAVVRPHVVLKCFFRILQKPVPLVVGVRDWKVQLLKVQPSQAVVAHFNEPPHLGLRFLGLKDHLIFLPIKIAASALAALQSAGLGRPDATEQVQGQQRENL